MLFDQVVHFGPAHAVEGRLLLNLLWFSPPESLLALSHLLFEAIRGVHLVDIDRHWGATTVGAWLELRANLVHGLAHG